MKSNSVSDRSFRLRSINELLTSWEALNEGIAGQFGETGTNRIVKDHDALGSDAARPWTGIYALLIVTGHIGGTIGIDGTLGPAVRWHVQVSGDARADGLLVNLSTLAVRSARCWVARVSRR